MPVKSLVTYNKTVLRNGLRIVTEKVPSARSVAIGVWIDTGSRDEAPRENGISHLIEHMLFKGTKTRSARKIASWLESVGGSLNAFTSREQTCYYALVLDEYLPHAVDILADITMNSTIKAPLLEKEQQVVLEEINEIKENPSDYVHDIFGETFWRGQAIGRPIIGTKRIVKSLKRDDLKNYIAKHYRCGRIVISAAGNVSHRRLVNLIRDKFHYETGDLGRGGPALSPTNKVTNFVKNNTLQNHVCIGFPAIPFDHRLRYPLLALHTYLGSGMSSQLFQRVREDQGMAYTIYTYADFYRDNGLFSIYFASDKRNLGKAIDIIMKELKKVKRYKIPKSRFDMIKAQFKGHLTLALESTYGRMNRIGRQEILSSDYCSLSQALDIIDKLDTPEIIETARKVLTPEGLTIVSLGPGSEKDIKSVDLDMLG